MVLHRQSMASYRMASVTPASGQAAEKGPSWLIIGASAVAAAGAAYCVYRYLNSPEGENNGGGGELAPSTSTTPAAAHAINPLLVARHLQQQVMMAGQATPRVTPRSTPRNTTPRGSKVSAATTPAASPKIKAFDPLKKTPSGGRKLCSHCGKMSAANPPLRCSQCKQPYCSRECQRQAWPEHKTVCQPPRKAPLPAVPRSEGSTSEAHRTSANGSLTNRSIAGDAASVVPAPLPATPVATVDHPHAGPSWAAVAAADPAPDTTSATLAAKDNVEISSSGTVHSDPAAASAEAALASAAAEVGEEPVSLDEALTNYLQQATTSDSNELDAKLRRAIMLYVGSEYRDAVGQLASVQALAREQGNSAVEGDVWKWLGHCHVKLADVAQATTCFEEGATFGAKQGNLKLQIDCLTGLGVLYSSNDQPAKAIEQLQRALAACPAGVDSACRASVLTNLGAALLASGKADPTDAILHLEEAAALREARFERMHEANDVTGLAAGIMEHAGTLISLASAYSIAGRISEARSAYERALQVFETVEDLEKVPKLLVSLANMMEMQFQDEPGAREAAAKYRSQLSQFLAEHGDRCPTDDCAVCSTPLSQASATPPGGEVLVLPCFHSTHAACWELHSKEALPSADLRCPTCDHPAGTFLAKPAAAPNSLEDEVD